MRALSFGRRIFLPVFILLFAMLFMLLSTNMADWVKMQGRPIAEVLVAR